MSLVERHALPAAEIEAESLSRLRAVLGADAPDDPVALRILYAAGDPGLAPAVCVHPGLRQAATAALRRGAPLVCDGRMTAAGIARGPAARLGCAVLTAIDDPEVGREAERTGRTRAALAMDRLAGALDGGIAVVGTAPTALLALLDLVDAGRCRPAAVLATPVGLVAAAEAKEELRARGRGLPYVTVRGSRGGSPRAAAAANALLAEAVGRREASRP
jgi:precorrin isomerase